MSELPSSLSNAFKRYLDRGGAKKATALAARNFSAGPAEENLAGVVPRQFEIQRGLRPLFGKGEPHEAIIGDHPDFAHLRETEGFEYHRIATMFMDIEASTRLSLLVDLETVHNIKNAFITAAIEIVQAFDGHIHRIMGDAVMAFFGGKNITGEQAVIDAMNAASVLRYFAEKIVIPNLKETFPVDSLGIRIGLDYGADPDVLWSCYGRPGTCEVTATSFFVDVAAKLQGNAGRNEVFIGDSIRSFIDFPDELVSTPMATRNGSRTDDPFVSPNHTDMNGNPRNYRKFKLSWDDYLECTPVARVVKDLTSHTQQRMPSQVDLKLFISEKRQGIGRRPYSPCSGAVRKGAGILFALNLVYQPSIPFTVEFRVENHGADATKRGSEGRGDHKTPYEVTRNGRLEFEHWEESQYRGLHYMIVDLKNDRGLQWRHRIGVFIE